MIPEKTACFSIAPEAPQFISNVFLLAQAAVKLFASGAADKPAAINAIQIDLGSRCALMNRPP